ncbi:hypothetical protein [Nocardia pseudobrasiliensis]|uniref:Uncharacterized protein n=1 Tax=Nocardia pseudobrasiliensis TaxID=45979 RepID=A0A370I6J7_9NOCA|nr:hypothetical protein [Nocardia pseudobrasiliensis]RDI66339.1 hypothetical protein DFR76_10485 [Nocardia pseudobrasiliensis]
MTLGARRCGRLALVALTAMLCFGLVSGGSYALADEPPDHGSMAGGGTSLQEALGEMQIKADEITDKELAEANLCTSAQEKQGDDDKNVYNECVDKRRASVRKRYDNILVDGKKIADDKRLSRITPYEMKGDDGVAPMTVAVNARAVALDVCGNLIERGGAYCDDIVEPCTANTCDALADYRIKKAGHGLKAKRGNTQNDSNLDEIDRDLKAAAILAYKTTDGGDSENRTEADKAEAVAIEMWRLKRWLR